MIIKLEEKQIELFSLWYEYLYPYLLRFSLKENIKWEDNIIYVNNKDRERFIEMLKNILIELMDELIYPTTKINGIPVVRIYTGNNGKIAIINKMLTSSDLNKNFRIKNIYTL